MYCRHPGSHRCTRSSLFHLDSRHRSRRSFGLAGFSPAARGFGSNGDRVDGAGTGREDHTDRGRTNYVGSNSEGIGTSGRGACPRQNSCQSAKLIRVSRANSDIPIPPGKNNIYRRKISSEELGSRPLTSGGDGNHAKIEITRNGCGPGQSG